MMDLVVENFPLCSHLPQVRSPGSALADPITPLSQYNARSLLFEHHLFVPQMVKCFLIINQKHINAGCKRASTSATL